MVRFFKRVLHAALVMIAAAAGFALVDGTIASTAVPGLTGLLAGAIGLCTGFFITWVRRLPWHELPARAQAWRSYFAWQLWWATLGSVSLAVLFFY